MARLYIIKYNTFKIPELKPGDKSNHRLKKR